MPLAAVGLPPEGELVASAIWMVGIQDFSGAGRAGEGPKVCSAEAVVAGSLQAARGSTRAPAKILSNSRLRMTAPCKSPLQCAGPADVHGFRYEFRVILQRAGDPKDLCMGLLSIFWLGGHHGRQDRRGTGSA